MISVLLLIHTLIVQRKKKKITMTFKKPDRPSQPTLQQNPDFGAEVMEEDPFDFDLQPRAAPRKPRHPSRGTGKHPIEIAHRQLHGAGKVVSTAGLSGEQIHSMLYDAYDRAGDEGFFN